MPKYFFKLLQNSLKASWHYVQTSQFDITVNDTESLNNASIEHQIKCLLLVIYWLIKEQILIDWRTWLIEGKQNTRLIEDLN